MRNATSDLPLPAPLEKDVAAGTRRVLVAEDHADIRLMMKFMLKTKGHVVLEASNGREAVEMAGSSYPDLILMDLSMPVLDGFEATRQIKALEATRHIPVVAVSAHCNEPDGCRKAIEAGCSDCVSKPVEWSLIDLILSRH
jgi:CheY-like chemotaxis protein